MKTLSLHPVSLLLGAAFSLTLALTLGAQGPILKSEPVLRQPAAFAPHPSDIWNYSSEDGLPGTSPYLEVAAGEVFELFAVPENRYLVVTGLQVRNFTGFRPDLAEELTPGQLVLKSQNVLLLDSQALVSYGNSGLVFRPGSKVVLDHTDWTGDATVAVDLVGYFVDAE